MGAQSTKPSTGAPVPNATTELVVLGMWDNQCRERVERALEAIAGVRDALVMLHRGRAVIVHTLGCSPAQLVRAVVAVGFGAVAVASRCP